MIRRDRVQILPIGKTSLFKSYSILPEEAIPASTRTQEKPDHFPRRGLVDLPLHSGQYLADGVGSPELLGEVVCNKSQHMGEVLMGVIESG
jgi:hypothetical protein